ncbi:hypothetical protein LTR17_016454, partial [Elasticomyces elasticus]
LFHVGRKQKLVLLLLWEFRVTSGSSQLHWTGSARRPSTTKLTLTQHEEFQLEVDQILKENEQMEQELKVAARPDPGGDGQEVQAISNTKCQVDVHQAPEFLSAYARDVVFNTSEVSVIILIDPSSPPGGACCELPDGRTIYGYHQRQMVALKAEAANIDCAPFPVSDTIAYNQFFLYHRYTIGKQNNTPNIWTQLLADWMEEWGV